MLSNYDRLDNYYKLPSRTLLEQEKKEYTDQIEKLRYTARFMVRKCKEESKVVFRKVMHR